MREIMEKVSKVKILATSRNCTNLDTEINVELKGLAPIDAIKLFTNNSGTIDLEERKELIISQPNSNFKGKSLTPQKDKTKLKKEAYEEYELNPLWKILERP
jgi:hypothetical protein